MFYRLSQNFFFSQKVAKCTKSLQLTHLMLIVFFYTYWKLWFFMFLKLYKKIGVMKCFKKWFLCEDNFCSVSLECEESVLKLRFKMVPQSRCKRVSQSRFKSVLESIFKWVSQSRFKRVPQLRFKMAAQSRCKKVPQSRFKRVP